MADLKTSSSVAIVDRLSHGKGGQWWMKHATSGGEGAASGDCIERMNYHYLKSGLSDQQEMV